MRKEKVRISCFHIMFCLLIEKFLKSIGFSLYELLYGREVYSPMDVIRELWESEEK